MKIQAKYLWLAICLLAVFSLVSCDKNASQTTPTVQQMIPTTITPSPTTPATLTPFPTLTSTPTYTPYPTLSPDEVQLVRDELTASILPTDNCFPPCVWGITPGETNFRETASVFRQISTSSQIREWDARVFMATIPVSEDVNINGQLNLQFMRENLQHEEIIAVTVAGYYYSMFELLNAYGEPELVYISASVTPTGFFEFNLYLFYSQNGLLVMYSSAITSVSTESDLISICDLNTQYSPWNSIGIITWNPDLRYSFDEVINGLPFYNGGAPIRCIDLEVISDIIPSEFYKNFSSENSECIEINIYEYYVRMQD